MCPLHSYNLHTCLRVIIISCMPTHVLSVFLPPPQPKILYETLGTTVTRVPPYTKHIGRMKYLAMISPRQETTWTYVIAIKQASATEQTVLVMLSRERHRRRSDMAVVLVVTNTPHFLSPVSVSSSRYARALVG